MTNHRVTHQPHDPIAERATPDMSNFLAAHEMIRRSDRMLVDGIHDTNLGDRHRIRAIRRWYRGYAGELRTHHRNEDEIYFPALAKRVPIFAEYEQSLADDHAAVHELIDELGEALAVWSERPADEAARDRAQAFAVNLRDLMHDHLEVEDRDILPLFERHVSVPEFAELDERMMNALLLKQAVFTVPWMIDNVDDERRRELWAMSPTMLKVIYRLTARRYHRLTTTAFGVQR